MPDPLFCPSCRSEFLASATRCVECDVALVPESALSDEAVEELPPIEELVCVRAASVGWAQGLSERLAAAGISHRIEVAHDNEDDGSVRRPGHYLPYGVYVLPADALHGSLALRVIVGSHRAGWASRGSRAPRGCPGGCPTAGASPSGPC